MFDPVKSQNSEIEWELFKIAYQGIIEAVIELKMCIKLIMKKKKFDANKLSEMILEPFEYAADDKETDLAIGF